MLQTKELISVSSTPNNGPLRVKAAKLAQQLGLSFLDSPALLQTPYLLLVQSSGVSVVQPTGRKGRLVSVLAIDFRQGSLGYRLAHDKTIQQPLARAVGLRSGFRPRVFDATGGLGGDGMVLAALGCKLTICERNPVLSLLLDEALASLAKEPGVGQETAARVQLISGDSREILQKQRSAFDTIYLDPMYPHRDISAKSKLPITFLRELVGEDQDSGELLQLALACEPKRVVVKRPRVAQSLGSVSPHHRIETKKHRFDVYLP